MRRHAPHPQKDRARRRTTARDALERTGIRRLGSPRAGFRYRTSHGRRPGRRALARIDALKVPPAWRRVRIAASPSRKVQAVGEDGAGRLQYRYHPRAVARREARKYERIIRFGEALPRLRRAVARDLRRPGLAKERVLACCARILSCCFIRAGSVRYARENGSFGLATLRRRHARVAGDLVTLDFPGKLGRPQHHEMRDRAVARVVRRCLRARGRELFLFEDGDGARVDVRRRHVNDYVAEAMGGRFTAKDFRTWAGTLLCASSLARRAAALGEGARPLRKTLVEAVKETAESLGNTPAVCRASYIFPALLERFQVDGEVVKAFFDSAAACASWRGRGLHEAERALLSLLKAQSGARGRRAREASLLRALTRTLARQRPVRKAAAAAPGGARRSSRARPGPRASGCASGSPRRARAAARRGSRTR